MHNGKGIFMKKNIYISIFYTILGLCINTPANASIISRSFLDEALTDYATTAALDLKADKADLTDLSDKIGTLTDGYETVGAALSAIKGIAEEAKAAALAAIPDPKTEGSNGKYVLTVDIIGDNATYRWEPIDRSNATATTE